MVIANVRIYSALFLIVGMMCSPSCKRTSNDPAPPSTNTFVNPLMNGSDPWVYQNDSVYYYTHTLGNRINLWKTDNMSKLAMAMSVPVFAPPTAAANSQHIWAPEIHRLDGKWYIYYTAGSGPDSMQRTWVLENSAANPISGNWIDKGRIYNTDTDFWAIDGTVFEHKGIRYFLWSGRPQVNQQNQNIYIAKMSNPWTLERPSVMLTRPELLWEINGPVNEAPQILKNDRGDVFLIYSASGCWTDDYALGILTLKPAGDPLNASDWIKSQQPVFSKKPENSAYAPGHNGFFKSKNGKEDWLIYHANTNSGDGCTNKRNIRMQRFTWNENGSPDLGEPVKVATALPVPAGE
jgi:GH43 family beta-xylosidase